MPVTFKVAPHDANQVKRPVNPVQSPSQTLAFLKWKANSKSKDEVLKSSLSSGELSSFGPRHDGFVGIVVKAYNGHHNLIIRPDDVWISILSQLNFYINAHAEELRSKFVSHDGQKELIVETSGNRYSVDFGKLANKMSEELKKNIKSPDFHQLIIPNFSTTTTKDVVIASVLMMSTLKAYFSYGFFLTCGIPSITLLGTPADWSSLASRIEKLDALELGPEVSAWCCLLRPVVAQFIAAFDNVDLHFWGRICSYERGDSGPDSVGGWITAFCPWSQHGKWLGAPHADITSAASALLSHPIPTWEPPPSDVDPDPFQRGLGRHRPLVYGGMAYPVVNLDSLPHGFGEVDVLVDDNDEKINCRMLAGHVGVKYSSSEGGDEKWDTLQASPQWFIYVKEESTEEGSQHSDFSDH